MAGARRGFSLIEAAIASLVLGLLAAATLNAVTAAAKSRQLEADRARARDLASDLLSEIVQQQYTEPGITTTTLGPGSGEVSGTSRALFDDVDDYNGLTESPPVDRDGSVLPGLTGWTRKTKVAWVLSNDPTTTLAAETQVKRVTVQVLKGGRVLASAVTLRTAAWDKAIRTGVTISAPVKGSTVGASGG